MRPTMHRGSPALAALTLLSPASPWFRIFAALLVLAASTSSAFAATYRYASSNNRIYVESGGTTTLTDILANTPSLPSSALVRSGNTWTLNAELWIRDGVTLDLHGSSIGGDVDELRLKSDSGGFIYISADYGTIDIDTTSIKSWDASAAGPDTNYSDGRAFIRVRSWLDTDGVTPRESRMDIKSSELSYLGYNGSEAYGLVWKVIGNPGTNYSLYDKVNVYGNITGSHLHHNYYGMYSFGLQGNGTDSGVWSGNESDHNVGYGFDPHDDSDDLIIENNDVHDNGYHGIIASKRCDHVVIRNNKSYRNKEAGIMLHRTSNDGTIEGNQAYDNADAGIALFAVWRTTVKNNTLTGNKYGVRLSMGAADNVVDSNEVGTTSKYGLYFYKGTDTPEPGDDGRPKRNTFTNNDVHDVTYDGIKMTDGNDNTFTGNSFTTVGSTFEFLTSPGTKLNNNAIPSSAYVQVKGSSSITGTITFYNQPLIQLKLPDSYATAYFRDSDNAAFDPDEPVYTTETTSSSLMTLTNANTGGSSTVYTRKLAAVPASGTIKVNPTTWNLSGDYSKAWKIQAPSSSVSVSYTVGDLVAGTAYDVYRGSSRIATITASSSGAIAFSSAPGSTSTVAYTVKPH